MVSCNRIGVLVRNSDFNQSVPAGDQYRRDQFCRTQGRFGPAGFGSRTPLYPGAYSDLYAPRYFAGSRFNGCAGTLSFSAKVYESSDGAAADSGCNDTIETVDHSDCFRWDRRTDTEESQKDGRLRRRIVGDHFCSLFLSDFCRVVLRKSAAVGASTEVRNAPADDLRYRDRTSGSALRFPAGFLCQQSRLGIS